MISNIRTKILFTFILTIALSSAINIGVGSFTIRKSLNQDLIDRIVLESGPYRSELSNMLQKGDFQSISDSVYRRMSAHRDLAYMLVLDPDGKVLASSLVGKDPSVYASYNILDQGEDQKVALVKQEDGLQVYDIATRLLANQGILRLGYYKQQIDNSTLNIVYLHMLGSAPALFFAIIFVFLFTRNLFKPLGLLENSLQKISSGDWTARAPVVNKDEIGRLATAFNSMAAHLQGLYSSMDRKIREKTALLSNKVDEVEKSKLAILNLLEDIEDEKKRVEEVVKERTKELSSEKARLLASMNSLSFGFIIADMNNHVLLKNKAMIELFGFDESEETFSVEHISELLEAQFDIKNRISLCMKDKSMCEIKEISSNDKFLRGVIAPVITPEDNELIGYVFLLEDITEAKLIDRAKSEFVSLASHQLRTPLSSINWYTEMLASGEAGVLNEEQKDYVEEVSNASRRMSDMVGMLLNVSRIELGTFIIEPVPTNICGLLADQYEQFKLLMDQKGMQAEILCNPKDIVVNIDPMIMSIAIQNLISNAIKYTPEKGRIKMEVYKDAKDNAVHISVSDNGYGISATQQAKIFTKLFRADNIKTKDTEGNGLGLYMVKTMLNQAGCTISFTSKEDQGTTFVISVPSSGMRKKAGTKFLGGIKST